MEWGLGTTVREFLIAFKQCHWMIKGHQLIAFPPITTSQQCHPLALLSLLLPLGSLSSSPMRISTVMVSVILGLTVDRLPSLSEVGSNIDTAAIHRDLALRLCVLPRVVPSPRCRAKSGPLSRNFPTVWSHGFLVAWLLLRHGHRPSFVLSHVAAVSPCPVVYR